MERVLRGLGAIKGRGVGDAGRGHASPKAGGERHPTLPVGGRYREVGELVGNVPRDAARAAVLVDLLVG